MTSCLVLLGYSALEHLFLRYLFIKCLYLVLQPWQKRYRPIPGSQNAGPSKTTKTNLISPIKQTFPPEGNVQKRPKFCLRSF